MAVIVVAEDEPALLDSFVEFIKELGHHVHAARDGLEALDLIKRERPQLVLTDFMMPRFTGVDLIRALKAEPDLAHTVVILVSAATPPASNEAWRFLRKPLAIDALHTAVAEGLRVAPHRSDAVPSPSLPKLFTSGSAEVLAWVAHEVRTPMSAALMAAELIVRERPDDKRAGKVVAQLLRAEKLIASILDAERLQTGELKLRDSDVDVGEVAQRSVDYWRDVVSDVPFHLEATIGDAIVCTDQARLEQILDNLLSNAAKHGRSEKGVRVEVSSDAKSVSISVQDYGPGIGAAHLPRIFERFFRVADDGRGHGLGLYIAASLAQALGATLGARSIVGEGSTFTLTIPRTAARATTASSAPVQPHDARSQGVEKGAAGARRQ